MVERVPSDVVAEQLLAESRLRGWPDACLWVEVESYRVTVFACPPDVRGELRPRVPYLLVDLDALRSWSTGDAGRRYHEFRIAAAVDTVRYPW